MELRQTLTAKLQILPDKDQERLLLDTMRAYLEACNMISEEISYSHDLRQRALNASLYYRIRELCGLRSQMAQSAIRSVIASYKTLDAVGKLDHGDNSWKTIRYKHGFYDLVWNRDYELKQDRFSVNTLQGRIHLKFRIKGHEHVFDGKSVFGTAKIIRKHGHFYICVSYTREIPDTLPVSNVVGVDLGVNFTAVSYDSHGKTRFWNGRQIKQKRAAYKIIRRDLQRRGTKSARKRLKKIGSRENRWMQDVNHQVSKALVNGNPSGSMFVLEDLTGIRNVTEKVRRKDRYAMVSWSFYDLRKKIEYKAERIGSQVHIVDPAYTSQTCPKCGYVHKGNRDKKKHLFACGSCGYRSNDDRIGAMNLHAKGIQYHSAVTMKHALS